MKFLGRYWKVIIAVLLLALAAYLYFDTYTNEKAAFENEQQQLKTLIAVLQDTIAENAIYADIQEDIPPALEAVQKSRQELYDHFPVEMKEEDQIMYVLYLETIFGTEISFSFDVAQPLGVLRDGSYLMGLTLTVNYETTYKGFQDMVKYLSTDSRITSVRYASIDYDAATDTARGTVTLLLYLVKDQRDYEAPNVAEPETGKDSIYS